MEVEEISVVFVNCFEAADFLASFILVLILPVRKYSNIESALDGPIPAYLVSFDFVVFEESASSGKLFIAFAAL